MVNKDARAVAEAAFHNNNQPRDADTVLQQQAARRAVAIENMRRLRALRLVRDKK